MVDARVLEPAGCTGRAERLREVDRTGEHDLARTGKWTTDVALGNGWQNKGARGDGTRADRSVDRGLDDLVLVELRRPVTAGRRPRCAVVDSIGERHRQLRIGLGRRLELARDRRGQ